MQKRPNSASSKKRTPESKSQEKTGLHPRNQHRSRYDFKQLIQSCPDLAPFVVMNLYNDESIDFANPAAVRMLNKALLAHFYGITAWDIPEHYLCPPIPGRADYLHYMADLLGECNGGEIPRGKMIHALDIGVGANCIYPLIGHSEYGWRFTGSDTDPIALASAKQIVASNNGLADVIQLQQQMSPSHVFKGLLKPEDVFDVVLCNPPFHASLDEAMEGTRRKWKNLGKEARPGKSDDKAPVLNFGGQHTELWCEGGEKGFVRRMIEESIHTPTQCLWFSTLISKEDSLPSVYGSLKWAGALDTRTINMAQGQKKSRIVAWTFLNASQREEWRKVRWG